MKHVAYKDSLSYKTNISSEEKKSSVLRFPEISMKMMNLDHLCPCLVRNRGKIMRKNGMKIPAARVSKMLRINPSSKILILKICYSKVMILIF